jgi:HK97 family phage major capsid protein
MTSQTRAGAIRFSDPIPTPFNEMHPQPGARPAAHAQPRIAPRHEAQRSRSSTAAVPAFLQKPMEFGRPAEFMRAVAIARQDGFFNEKLVRAPAGLSEADPSGGGFLVPEDWSQTLIRSMFETSILASRCDRRTTDRPLAATKIPGIDETSRADGSRWGGTASYWEGEGISVSPSLPRFRQLEFTGRKLTGVIYVTEELLDDAPQFERHVEDAFAAEFGFQIDNAILNGSGSGKPLGIIGAPASITVNPETGQAAATIVKANVDKMLARLPSSCRANAAWIVHEDQEPELHGLAQVVGTGGSSVYAYATDGSPFGRLLGIPVLLAEQSPSPGAAGDCVLADLSKYVLIESGLRSMLSVHADFIHEQPIFRFTLRIDGKPIFHSPVTSYSGSTTRSPFVILGARS